MSEDIDKYLLSEFYGFQGDRKERHILSSAKGIESFENVTDIDCPSTEYLISSEEPGKTQYTEDDSEKAYDENNECSWMKSSHVLTIEDLLRVDEKTRDEEDLNLELEIIDDPQEDKNVPPKNLTKLEDTFSKAMSKISETPAQDDVNSSLAVNNFNVNFTANPVKKAKKMWRQKTILATRENAVTSANLLKKLTGTHLNLNNAGIYVFPMDILQQLEHLQMLYLDSNNLTDLPEEMFTMLKNLKWLDVRNNHLVIIPLTIKGHAHLETLLLQGNNIEKLPLELGLVRNLENLQVARNPLKFPPKEILDLDCSRIMNFLRTLWNNEHPDEIAELKLISDNKIIAKKSSTIICYQSRKLKKGSKSSSNDVLAPRTSKASVRLKSWNYKPSSRYGKDKCSWVLRRVNLAIEPVEVNLDDAFLICNFCAASLYRKGVHVENEFCNSDYCRQTVRKSIKQHEPRIFRETKVYSPESMTESNFLHLLGPSPRSLFIRKNLDFLANAKRKNVKLCQMGSKDFHFIEYNTVKLKDVKAFRVHFKEQVFDVITNDRVQLKIKPMQLKEPDIIFNFLKAYLGIVISNDKHYVKNKKKRL